MLRNIMKAFIIWSFLSHSAIGLASDIASGVTAYSLANGLKVILYPENSKDEITVNAVYKTGSKHENPGEYGMAHLLEHMLYKNARLDTLAARLNASTNADRTSYHETLPASALNLEAALAAEADRMHRAVFTDEAVESELSVVKNEWEQSANGGFGPLLKEMLRITWPHHAYGRDTLGVRDGVLDIKPAALRLFYQKRYAPNLAVLAVGGAFDKSDAQRLIEKYFAALPPAPVEDKEIIPTQSIADGKQIILPRAPTGGYVGVLYRAMKGSDPEFVAAQALVHALGGGSQSVLQKELVRKGLAVDAFGFVQQNVDEGFIAFFAKPAKGQNPLLVAQKMATLLENSAKKAVSIAALNRFTLENTQGWDEMLRDSRALTLQLAEYEILGDWRLMMSEQASGRALRVEDVQAVGRWLTPGNRTLGVQGDSPRAVIRSSRPQKPARPS